MSEAAPACSRRRPANWRLIGFVAACTATLIALFVKARPDLVFTSAFLFQDQGNHLLVAARLTDGGMLYRDVAYPYGPLPAMLGVALAYSFGISALTYVVLQALLNAAFLVLLAHVLSHHVPPHAVAAIVLLGVLPLSMAPSATAGAAASNTYIGLERLVAVVLLWTWTPPEERTHATSVVAGLGLILWQLVKVGGAGFWLAAWLVVDVLTAAGRGRAVWRRLVRGWGVMIGVALAAEACRWATLFLTLPAPIAFDAAWPAYTLEHYRSIPTEIRSRGLSVVELATHAAVPLAALGLAFLSVRRQLTDTEGRRALGLLIPSAFFVFGWAGYFGHREIMWQYAWTAIPGAAFAVAYAGRSVKIGASLIAMPAVVLLLASIGGAVRVGATEPMRMSNGDALWMNAPTRDAATALLSLLQADRANGRPGKTVVIPSGGGLYFYTGTSLLIRHPWVIDRYIRPYEWDVIAHRVRGVEHVAFTNEAGLTEERFDARVGATLGPAVQEQWRRRLVRIERHRGWSLVTLGAAK